MLKKIKAGGLADKVQASKDSLAQFKETSTGKLNESRDKAQQTLEKNWPVIEKIVTNGLVGIATEKLADDHLLESAIEKAYEMLPMPIRLIVGRDRFVSYCMRHRDPILERVSAMKQEGEAIAVSPIEQPLLSSPELSDGVPGDVTP